MQCRCKKWVENCGRTDFSHQLPDELHRLNFLCAEHFTPNQFTNVLQNRLSWKAVPSIFGTEKTPKTGLEDGKSKITQMNGAGTSTYSGEHDLEDESLTAASDDLASNYRRQLTSKLFDFSKKRKFCDTVIIVQGKHQAAHNFYTHSVILAASNDALHTQLSKAVGSTSKSLKPDIRFCIPIKDCDPVAVEIALRYIYTGQLVVPAAFADGTRFELVLAACRSLGVPLAMLDGARLVIIEQDVVDACSPTVESSCQSESPTHGSSGTDFGHDHPLNIKIECDQNDCNVTDNVRLQNCSSVSFQCPASHLHCDDVEGQQVDQQETNSETEFTTDERTHRSASATSPKVAPKQMSICCKPAAESVMMSPSQPPCSHSVISQPSAVQLVSSHSRFDTVIDSMLKKAREVPKDLVYTCSRCDENFRKVKELRQHAKNCSQPKRPARRKACKVCGEKFYNVIDRRRHFRDTHGLVCQTCGLRFLNAGNLKRHQATHRTTPRYSCQPCGLTFQMDYIYRYHRMKFHGSGTKSFLCHVCGATFLMGCHLIRHSRTHRLPYICEKCGKRYSAKKSLEEHLLSCQTGGKKPYVCDVCGTAFSFSVNLRRHSLSHQNGLQICSECGKSFRHKQNLVLHLRECHGGGSAGLPAADKRCIKCGKAFVYKTHLDRHLRTHDNNQEGRSTRFERTASGAEQKGGQRGRKPREGNLACKKVSQDGPYKCNICNRGFGHTRNLGNHMFVHQEHQTFVCPTCGRVFSHRRYLTIHMVTHGTKAYPCSECDKLFRHTWTRDLHMRSMHHQLDA